MRVHAMSREDAERYTPWGGWEVCISITDPEDPFYGVDEAPPAELSDDFGAVLRLQFLDVDDRLDVNDQLDDEARARLEELRFEEDQAAFIAVFVAVNPLVDAIVVHCEAGVSRSVGVARAISEWRGADPDSSRAMHGCGNQRTRRLVLDAFESIADAARRHPHP